MLLPFSPPSPSDRSPALALVMQPILLPTLSRTIRRNLAPRTPLELFFAIVGSFGAPGVCGTGIWFGVGAEGVAAGAGWFA